MTSVDIINSSCNDDVLNKIALYNRNIFYSNITKMLLSWIDDKKDILPDRKKILYHFITKDTIIKNGLEKELEKTGKNIEITVNKKVDYFLKAYRIFVDYNYELDDPILYRHLLLETIEEINKSLIENDRQYRINFSEDSYNYFLIEIEEYLTKHNFYNDDNETINYDKLRDRFNQLRTIVTFLSPSKDLHIMPKKTETDLYELLI